MPVAPFCKIDVLTIPVTLLVCIGCEPVLWGGAGLATLGPLLIRNAVADRFSLIADSLESKHAPAAKSNNIGQN